MAVNYNDGKWHGWNGGECPVHPETVVDVQWSDDRDQRKAKDANGLWGNSDGEGHIVAFRVVKEYREPREFWIKQITWTRIGGSECDKTWIECGENEFGSIRVREVIE